MNNRDKAFIALSQGKDIEEIADEMGVTYSTVVRYRKEYEVAETEGKLSAILSQDEALIRQIAEGLPEDVTSGEFLGKLQGLEKLNANTQVVAELLLVKLKTVISNSGVDDVTNLSVAARILCDLQNAFFNKNSVNVNVQNNNFDATTSKYGDFLSDKPNN